MGHLEYPRHLNILAGIPKTRMRILISKARYTSTIYASTMSDYVPDTRSALPATLPTRLSPPRPKKRRRELSNAQRAEVRHHFYHSLSPKPTQKELILCNHNLARLCGAAEGGLSRTSSTTGVLRE